LDEPVGFVGNFVGKVESGEASARKFLN